MNNSKLSFATETHGHFLLLVGSIFTSALLLAGCAFEAATDVGRGASPIVSSASSATARDPSQAIPSSVVTVVAASEVVQGTLRTRAPLSPRSTPSGARDFCPEEPFANLPRVTSICAGVLIAPDLVMTANHCVGSGALPYVVRGYQGAMAAASYFDGRVSIADRVQAQAVYRYDVPDVAFLRIRQLSGGQPATLYCGSLESRSYTGHLYGNGEGLPLMHRSGPTNGRSGAITTHFGDSGGPLFVDGARVDGTQLPGSTLVGVARRNQAWAGSVSPPAYLGGARYQNLDGDYGIAFRQSGECVFRWRSEQPTAQFAPWEDVRDAFCADHGQDYPTLCDCPEDEEEGTNGADSGGGSAYDGPMPYAETVEDFGDFGDWADSSGGGSTSDPVPSRTCGRCWFDAGFRDHGEVLTHSRLGVAQYYEVCVDGEWMRAGNPIEALEHFFSADCTIP